MTSKEALEKLNNFISREKHINSEWNKKINECINTIKQDLERLEDLEQEHANALQVIKILTDENKAQEMKKKVGWF